MRRLESNVFEATGTCHHNISKELKFLFMKLTYSLWKAYNASSPLLTQIEERFHLTDTLKDAIRREDYEAIDREKEKVTDDLKPIYDKIKAFGEGAFGRYRNRRTGEILFVCKTATSSVVLRTRQNKDKTKFLAVSSYSGAGNGTGWMSYVLDTHLQFLY